MVTVLNNKPRREAGFIRLEAPARDRNPGKGWKAGERIRTADIHVGNVTLYH